MALRFWRTRSAGYLGVSSTAEDFHRLRFGYLFVMFGSAEEIGGSFSDVGTW